MNKDKYDSELDCEPVVVDRSGPPRVLSTATPINGRGCEYIVAGVLPVTKITTEHGPNNSSQGAVESMLFAGNLFDQEIASVIERRSHRWEDLIDDPRFLEISKEDSGAFCVAYRDPLGQTQRISSHNATNLLDVWAAMCAKWGDMSDGIG